MLGASLSPPEPSPPVEASASIGVGGTPEPGYDHAGRVSRDRERELDERGQGRFVPFASLRAIQRRA